MAYEETDLEKKRRLQDAPQPLTPEDAAWLQAYDEAVQLQRQADREAALSAETAGALSAGIRKLSPQWLDDAAPTLFELYKDSLKLEYAYNYFVENYVENGYQERIEEATSELMASTGGTAAGSIASVESAIAALGPVELNTGGGHVKGTNWLNVKTKWRQFGLITGYNMQFQAKSVLDIRKEMEEQGSWSDFVNDADDVARTQQLLSVQSPRYRTMVGGSSEPGLSLAALEAEDNPGTSVFVGGETNWFYSKVHKRNAAPPGAESTTTPSNVHQRRYNPGDSSWPADLLEGPGGGYSGAARALGIPPRGKGDTNRFSLDPLFYGTTIQINNYFDQNSTAAAPMYGHLLSPEIMDLLTLVGVDNKKLDRQTFLDARASLMTSGIDIWNAAAQKLDRGGYNSWIWSAASAQPNAAAETTSAWSRAFNAYGNRAHASYNGPNGPSPQKSKSSKVVDTPRGQHIFPDRLALLHTLPLEGIPFHVWGPGVAPTDYFPGEIEDGKRLLDEASFAAYRTHIDDVVPAQVKTAWRTLFEGFENKSNNLSVLDTSIRNYIGTEFKDLFGDPIDSDKGQKVLHDHVERILDFFGAGAISEDTSAQAREKGITGGKGAAPTLKEVDPTALDVVANYRQLKPFDLQCFLMENVDAVTELHKKNVAAQPYKNVVALTNPRASLGGPGTTISRINHIGDDAAKALLDLPTAVYGALTPYIKLYRVDYDPETGMIPIGQQEIPIPNYTREEDIIGSAGRYKGWGLQSFTWKLDGVQPAEVDNNISANLSFYFQTINELFEGSDRNQGGFGGGGKKAVPLDLLISAATLKSALPQKDEKKDQKPEEKPKTCKAAQNAVLAAGAQYDGAQFRIKVVAGWATPPRHVLREVWPEPHPRWDTEKKKLDAVTAALKASRIALYLQQTRHNLTFNENGSVKLSIDYQAAISGILTNNKMDILGPTDKQTKALLETLEKDVEKSRKKINDVKQEAVTTHPDAETRSKHIQSETKGEREAMKKLLEEKKELLNADRLKKYRKFLEGLYGRQDLNLQNRDATQTQIYTMRVETDELVKTPLGQITDPEERAKRAREKMSKSTGFSVSEIGGRSSFNTNLLDSLAQTGGNTADDEPRTVSQNITNQWNKSMREGKETDVMDIPYFYLGDLVDMILETNVILGTNNEPSAILKSNFRMFLADIDITNPLLLYQFENSDEIVCANTINDNEVLEQLRKKGLLFNGSVKKRINIGDIPISIDQFNIWFKNHVIKNQRNSYYLLHFLKDICASLIGEALKKGCIQENVVDDIRFDTAIVHFNNKDKDSGLPHVGAKGTGNVVSVDRLTELVRSSTPENDIPKLATAVKKRKAGDEKFFNKYNITSGLILYSTDASPRDRKGDQKHDLESGIYHHYIGSPVGLVKKASFSRQEQTYLREAKIQKFGNLGAQQLRELYSVRLDLVGNSLFKNGQYTFIRPTMAGTDVSLVRLLGLAGYFLITGVSHTISPSGYNVSLTALQEGLDFESGTAPVVGVALDVPPDIERAPTDRAQQHADAQYAAALGEEIDELLDDPEINALIDSIGEPTGTTTSAQATDVYLGGIPPRD